MAKKSVATYRDKSANVNLTKVIVPYKNAKTGAYSFKEEMVPQDQVKEYLKSLEK